MKYTSINNEKIKNYRKLHQKKYRDQTGTFLVEGMHLVLEAFRAGLLKEIIIEDNDVVPIPVDVSYATPEVIKSLSTLSTPSNIIGVCNKKEESSFLGSRLIFLDNVQDPGNIGTIIRSAVAFDIDTVILKDSVDIYNDKVIRATQGMVFHKNIVFEHDYEFLTDLKNKGYETMGTSVTNGKNIKKVEKSRKFVIILGNEGSGLSDEVLELCTKKLYIPMNDRCESLNVAVAASIIMYEFSE